jgi:LPS-assembly protein
MPSKKLQVPLAYFHTENEIFVSKAVLSHSQRKFSLFPQTLIASLLCSMVFPVLAQTQKSVKEEQKSLIIVNDKNQATYIKGDTLTGKPDVYLTLDTNVQVVKGDTKVKANTATYRNLEDQVIASGDVLIQRKRDCYSGDTLEIGLETNAGFVTNPTYHLEQSNAQGKAERIDFMDSEKSKITNGTYTTCEGLKPDWYLKTDTLNLDTGIDRGVAKNAVLYFKGLPIPTLLSFSFPLSAARHSGVLPPTIGHSNKGGIEFGMPYYFNIAPELDATVLPKIIARRGLQLGVEGRYLGASYAGETAIEAIHDQLTDSTRYALNSIHSQRILPQLNFSWNVNKASDNNYPSDFSNSTAKTAQRLLLREAGFDYYGSYWNANLRTTSYQVLQDITAPIAQPYDRMPQLSFHAARHDVMGVDWSLDTLLTRFWHPTLVRGSRAVIVPQISIPFVTPAFFITPNFSVYATNYQLDNPAIGQNQNLQAVAPSVSIDTGLVFERRAKLFNEEMTQTLEPRLFYVKTPYRDQSNFPLFDTAIADFNFAQIFSANRFTGYDRISDSNQVTAGLVSRYIEDNGNERFKFAVGQRFHFNKQRVSLDGTTNPNRTDLLLAGNGQLSTNLNIEAALQINQSDRQTARSSYAVHWQPAPKKILNLQYQFQRDVLKQIELSGQWPVALRWYAVGKGNYSLQNKKLVEGLAGFEYRADCWAVRVVAHRFATTNLSNNSGFSIQLELNGLARLGLGSNPIESLKKNITGYQP